MDLKFELCNLNRLDLHLCMYVGMSVCMCEINTVTFLSYIHTIVIKLQLHTSLYCHAHTQL